MNTIKNQSSRIDQSGGALITSLILVAVLTTVVSAAISLHIHYGEEATGTGLRTRARYAAETGLNETLIDLAAALRDGVPIPTTNGTQDSPVTLRRASYWTTTTQNPDDTFTVIASGSSGDQSQAVRAIVRASNDIYSHAIFAGNSGLDPLYTLNLGGAGAAADQVSGDVYSGGDLLVRDDAVITGEPSAAGVVAGTSGAEGLSLPLPDIAAQNYEAASDVLVADNFGSAVLRSNPLGGEAWELPESDPAHIFRRNPSDRSAEINSTSKDDYFLEDPFEDDDTFTTVSNKKGYSITLSGADGGPGPDGNGLTYFIDGNLWLHSAPAGGYRFEGDSGEGVAVTIVVRGNIYLSDDLELLDPDRDGIALIALVDESEDDSGNIYLGDPRFGTLKSVSAFLYAENNFIDNNLSASGGRDVTINGNMTAGNQVAIERDFELGNGEEVHSKLSVNFDNRIMNGSLDLPGLPQSGQGFEGLEVLFWSRIAVE